ncbi:glutamate ABC transporter substrate-binding protein [Aerococcus urinae]|uniref:Glutamate ABC transporter substrate-binding protein n=1 Tax=Aerococcus mictus TaxID=2976810 RepID=A0A1E9PQ83_9LACT|nr:MULTISPECIES: glutamate ABC transporter substrate-binding protein [Aerococcus]KAA9292804.1 glutamate ABC transporter substrate-binding protein [Aerococcus mictus]MBU5609919.1 glutamate ABC transporter substrate-binding protein [Aerococcus urinae]MCY3033799.1 glutamate ABC transporter substrate-binding protein [Aerococcus mictus]MCY3063088.1 glutamate ABC transporter substrate-binding protein [Aerococcus mictus]MCY3065102.1 glutamate ABC transporter substrate-binding protein [Aerococcus mict
MKNPGKKLLLLALTGLLCLLSACGKSVSEKNIMDRLQTDQPPKIRWGVKVDTNLFGFYNIEKGEVEGFDIDIAKELTKRIAGPNAQAEFVEVTSKTRIPLLKNANIDAIIATMTISEERKKQVDFSDIYFNAGQALLVGPDVKLKGIEDLGPDHTVLAVKGSTSAQRIKEHAPEAKVLELENYSEAFTALKSGQGQAMTTDNAILLGISKENPDYHIAGSTFTREPYGIAVNKGQDDFRQAINQGLKDMVADGSYQAIFKKWFGDQAQEASIANDVKEGE